jgi:hypothetical protein
MMQKAAGEVPYDPLSCSLGHTFECDKHGTFLGDKLLLCLDGILPIQFRILSTKDSFLEFVCGNKYNGYIPRQMYGFFFYSTSPSLAKYPPNSFAQRIKLMMHHQLVPR